MSVPRGLSLPPEPLCLATQEECCTLSPNSSAVSWKKAKSTLSREDKSAAEDKHKGAGLSPKLGQKSCPHYI